MNSESQRLHLPPDIHAHEDPPDDMPRPVPEGEPEPGDPAPHPHAGARLWRENGVVHYQDDAMDAPEAVRLLWVRPLSGRGGPVSVMLAQKKKEVAYFSSLSDLPPESRTLAEEELRDSLIVPVIREIHRVNPRFGNFYWDVDTDKGRRTFLILSPENNCIRVDDDRLILRDVSGNCYEIPSLSQLSPASRREMARMV